MSKQTSDIIWNWKADPSLSEKGHTKARFWLQAAVMAVLGSFFFLFTDHLMLPCFLWTLTGLLLAGLLFSDRILKGFDRTGAWLARAVGSGLTWLLLTPFFYIVFGLGRLSLVLARKDPLNRKLDPQAISYWTDHPNTQTGPRHQKQF